MAASASPLCKCARSAPPRLRRSSRTNCGDRRARVEAVHIAWRLHEFYIGFGMPEGVRLRCGHFLITVPKLRSAGGARSSHILKGVCSLSRSLPLWLVVILKEKFLERN